MFIVSFRDSCGTAYLNFSSVDEVRGWSKFTGKVLGEPEPYVETYSIKKSDGSKLSEAELTAVQQEDSRELFAQRQREAYAYLGAEPQPWALDLYHGRDTARAFQAVRPYIGGK